MNQQIIHINPTALAKEVKFKMSTSSGNGGQNVNRVATKARLLFDVDKSILFDDTQKAIIKEKLGNRIAKNGSLIIANDTTRSAEKNKKAAVITLMNLLQKVLTPKKVRKKVKLPNILNEKRLAEKRKKSEKKQARRNIWA